MMQTAAWSKFSLGAALVISALSFGAPAHAAQADIDLLQSYVGNWKGRGVTNAAGGDETIVCRMDISESEVAKVNYNGRCSLAGGNISIRGTMAFVHEANRFEAVMSSNTAFQGVAVGRRRGSNINFNLRERNPDTGAEYAIDANMALKSGDIEVVFTLTEVATKKKIVAKVPFKK
jgi:hypothetical protein